MKKNSLKNQYQNPYLKDAKKKPITTEKIKELQINIEKAAEESFLETNTGLRINDDQSSTRSRGDRLSRLC